MSIIKSRSIDRKSFIEEKDVIVARSGMYTYTRAEILARGHKPARVKDFYIEFRPAAVIAAAAPLFDMVPVPGAEHADSEFTPENFRERVSAMVGGPIEIVPMPDGINIGLKGRIKFFTKEAHNYYTQGNKETSADYQQESVLVDNPDEVGYDLILTKITSVNNVAITAAGRGGKDVRIQDSASPGHIFDRAVGGKQMKSFKQLLGIPADGEKKFSAIVKDSLIAMKTATNPEDKERIISSVTDSIAELVDSPVRSALLSIVRDSFAYPEKVLDKWKESEAMIDGVHARCLDAGDAIVSQVTDADAKAKKEAEDKEKDDKEKKEAKEKEGNSKDSVLAVVDEKIGALRKELPDIIAESIKKALVPESGAPGAKGARSADSAAAESLSTSSDDVAFAIDGVFGRR